MIFIFILSLLYNPHQQFIDRFSYTAKCEQLKYGIPASITLAQAILETGGGASDAFKLYNNAFGLQCKRTYHSNCCVMYTDVGRIRLRKFSTAWEGFRAHSIHITSGRYASLTNTCGNDPYKWTAELQRLGYSQVVDYGARLTRVIIDYDLQQYD